MKSFLKSKLLLILIFALIIVVSGTSYIILSRAKNVKINFGTSPKTTNNQTVTNQTQPISNSTEDTNSYYIRDKRIGSYIWFSGSKWLLLDKTSDSLTLYAADPIAILNYNLSVNINNNYSLSYVRNWLNEKYYNTLNNKELLMRQTLNWRDNSDGTVDSVYDYVGMLTKDDYIKNKDILNISKYNWTMSAPAYNTDKAYYIANDGNLDIAQVDNKYSVSPIIKIKNIISIKSGDGTKASPYTVAEERLAQAGEKLNTRHTGEYVSYSGLTWRVVDVEPNKTTKLLYNNVVWFKGFDTRNLPIYYPDDKYNIGNYLNTVFYGNLENSSWIVRSDWYLKDYGYKAPVEDPTKPSPYANYVPDPVNPKEKPVAQLMYERKKIESISAQVGLLRFGDLLTSTDINADWWLITQLNNAENKLYYVYYTSGIISQADAFTKCPARPAINLDSAVYITGGEGTIDKPYTLAR